MEEQLLKNGLIQQNPNKPQFLIANNNKLEWPIPLHKQ